MKNYHQQAVSSTKSAKPVKICELIPNPTPLPLTVNFKMFDQLVPRSCPDFPSIKPDPEVWWATVGEDPKSAKEKFWAKNENPYRPHNPHMRGFEAGRSKKGPSSIKKDEGKLYEERVTIEFTNKHKIPVLESKPPVPEKPVQQNKKIYQYVQYRVR